MYVTLLYTSPSLRTGGSDTNSQCIESIMSTYYSWTYYSWTLGEATLG